ncbi:thioredoxin TrxC [Denitromonas ohlonensis]|uniref:Thioredoxin n=2 Tax=Denitromonas TaxID=139331 RepID=A0A557RVN6_9RHOO|nr:thioredoxin TrxC [Denitromonas ohlonensis]TVO69204.1 thioredoxin TrxC [Denitromonas ohlonensis]TVO77304.1 thioredoxin TrxC [Denitromonas ohlonensis]TVT50297.1 MAG: thioredoxin TrxC [Denitromonas halophila]TVT74968.1 MAG: thioredoxin TrxC [Denitromonas halophila]
MPADTPQVVCPHCQAVNRVPAHRLGDGARCGKCREPLIEGKAIPTGAPVFERHLANDDLPVLVDFWAPWCGPCRSMAPAFEATAKALMTEARLLKVNTEDEQALAGRYNIRSIPTLVLFRGGREVARISGAMDATRLAAWTRENL